MVFAGFWTTGLPSVENKIWQSPLYPEFACAIYPRVFTSTLWYSTAQSRIPWGFVYGEGYTAMASIML